MVTGLPFCTGMHCRVAIGTNTENSGLKLKMFYLWTKGLTEVSKKKFQSLSGWQQIRNLSSQEDTLIVSHCVRFVQKGSVCEHVNGPFIVGLFFRIFRCWYLCSWVRGMKGESSLICFKFPVHSSIESAVYKQLKLNIFEYHRRWYSKEQFSSDKSKAIIIRHKFIF